MSDDLYLGIPNVIWEECCNNAEEMLYEEEIGQHVVGLYPTAPRIYGEESALTSLLCLYIDSSESFLNPLYKSKEGIYMINGSYTAQVEYINLFNWIKSLKNQIRINHLIPCFERCFYQDENIDRIIACVREYLLNVTKFDLTYIKDLCIYENSILNTFFNIKEYRPSNLLTYKQLIEIKLKNLKKDIQVFDTSYLEKQLSDAAIEYFKWMI